MRRIITLLAFLWKSTSALVATALVIVAFALGLSLRGGGAGPDMRSSTGPTTAPASNGGPTMYTCAMHPQVRLPDPEAKCPICNMDLVPVPGAGAGDEHDRVLVMTPDAVKLAEIRTTPVTRMFPTKTVHMYGRVDYDETRIAMISAYFPGRLDRLFVDYTGIVVRPGDHLVEIYSPALVTAETELVTMRRNLDRLRGTVSPENLRSFEATVEGAREKLRLWGLTLEQIQAIEETGETPDHLTIFSPMGGVVIRKHKVSGEYVDTGEPIFEVADLSHLWVRLDAYESDLRWVRYGQDVEFTSQAFPGETFHGRIAFIDPQVTTDTRTVKLRVNVDNADGRLKPGMFVRATVRPVIAGAGEVISETLAGKWVCRMHPEIVKDDQAPCDICGMDLVRAESLGYVHAAGDGRAPLVIPATAPLVTGTRAIVYLRLPDRDRPTFEGREIVLGPRAGAYYIVREDVPGGANLAEGDEIVVNGAFKIDSSLQIQAKPSMMSAAPVGEAVDDAHDHDRDHAPPPTTAADEGGPGAGALSLEDLEPVYAAYFDVQAALATDDLERARRSVRTLRSAATAVDSTGLADAVGEGEITDIDAARALFETISTAVIELDNRIGHAGPGDHFVTFCPMAFSGRGASWLARTPTVANPYYGASMLRCGSVKSTIRPRDAGGPDGGEP